MVVSYGGNLDRSRRVERNRDSRNHSPIQFSVDHLPSDVRKKMTDMNTIKQNLSTLEQNLRLLEREVQTAITISAASPPIELESLIDGRMKKELSMLSHSLDTIIANVDSIRSDGCTEV